MSETLPLVSCIMPTTGSRKRFVERSIAYFQVQDYPNKELIIVVDEDDTMVGEVVPAQENILFTTIYSERKLNVGTKRNLACSLAHGDYIAFFDDDDYHGSQRLTKQVEPLLRGEAEFSAMRMSLLIDANKGELWAPSDDTHRRCFKQDVQYGTLMFKASYWRGGTFFPFCQVGEDRRFVYALLAQEARLARIVDPASFAYVLHGKNTTPDMRLVHPDGWEQVPIEQYLSEEDRAFYRQLRAVQA